MITKIGYDIDGCVIDSAPWFSLALMLRFDTEDIRLKDDNGKEMFYFSIPTADPKVVTNIINYTIVKYHHAMREVQGAKYWIRYITCIEGQNPIYLTARQDYGGMTDSKLHEWMFDNDMPRPYIYKRITEHHNKPKHVQDLGLTHYVEDRYRNAHEIAPYVSKVYLLNTDYNDRPLLAPNIKRVFGWQEIAEDYLGES